MEREIRVYLDVRRYGPGEFFYLHVLVKYGCVCLSVWLFVRQFGAEEAMTPSEYKHARVCRHYFFFFLLLLFDAHLVCSRSADGTATNQYYLFSLAMLWMGCWLFFFNSFYVDTKMIDQWHDHNGMLP